MKIIPFLISALLACCLWMQTTSGFMSLDEFNQDIFPICYLRHDDQNKELPNGQEVPIPNTLETFVSLVEKIERLRPNLKVEDIVKVLLISFRYDDLKYTPGTDSFESLDGKQTTVFDMLKQIFNNPTGQKLAKDDLTEDEKCALYFMISHTVNGTIREGDETVADSENEQRVKFPREQGVVALNSNIKHSFALGKVLLGIYAGLKQNSMKVNAFSVYKNTVGNQATELEILKNLDINPLYAATFGDLMALSSDAANEDGKPITNAFLPNGWWNDLDCPLYYNLVTNAEYVLLKTDVHTTYASIRGAIDGYVLGKMMPEIIQSYRDIRLSQILRGYYSNEGLSILSKDSSWCHRQVNFNNLKPDLKTEAVSYGLLYAACLRKTITSGTKDLMTRSIDRLFDRINQVEGEIITDVFHDDGTCSNAQTRKCETDNSILAIMDYKTGEVNRITQTELFGNLTSGLQMSYYGSTASIYTNLKPLKGVENGLEAILNYTTNSGCASCAAKYYRPRQIMTESETSVFLYLNTTLTLFDQEQEQQEKIGVPAKVVLYFNFVSPTDEWQLRDAIWTVRKYHRDANIIAIGTRKESLKMFVRDEETDIIITPPFLRADFHKSLKERICKIPATFQYRNCHSRTDSDEMGNKYEGFITPGHIQHWAMYPKYFLKSYRISLAFQALSGQLKVCFSRYREDIYQKEPKSNFCQDTSSNSENKVLFYVRNPCHRYSEDACPPFYFYLEAKNTASNSAKDVPCTDARCKTPDQIQFQFTHQGISCNKGFRISCFFTPAFYPILASIIWYFSSRKY